MNDGNDNVLLDFALSDEVKRLMVWAAQEADTDVNSAMWTILENRKLRKKHLLAYIDLQDILKLRKQCEEAEVAVKDVRIYLRERADLRKNGIQPKDMQKFVELAEVMKTEGLSFRDGLALLKLYRRFTRAGVKITNLKEFGQDIETLGKLTGMSEVQFQDLLRVYRKLQALGVELKQVSHFVNFSEKLQKLGLVEEEAQRCAELLQQAEKQQGLTRKHALEECALYIAQAVPLKASLASLQTRESEASARLESLNIEVNKLAERKTNLTEERAGLYEHVEGIKLEIAGLEKELEQLKAEKNSNALTINYSLGLAEYLMGGEVSESHQFWTALRNLLNNKMGQGSLSAPAPLDLSVKVRRELFTIIIKAVVRGDVTRNELKTVYGAAVEDLARILKYKHDAAYEYLKESVTRAKKGDELFEQLLDSVEYPNSRKLYE